MEKVSLKVIHHDKKVEKLNRATSLCKYLKIDFEICFDTEIIVFFLHIGAPTSEIKSIEYVLGCLEYLNRVKQAENNDQDLELAYLIKENKELQEKIDAMELLLLTDTYWLDEDDDETYIHITKVEGEQIHIFCIEYLENVSELTCYPDIVSINYVNSLTKITEEEYNIGKNKLLQKIIKEEI